MPICLVDASLGGIKECFNSVLAGNLTPCQAGCEAAIELAEMANASECPNPEVHRRDKFSCIISKLVGRTIYSVVFDSCTTDGSIFSASEMAIYHQEVKDEVGSLDTHTFHISPY